MVRRIGQVAGEIARYSGVQGSVGGGKKRITVGISDMKVSKDPESFIITHSLGPCIGMIFFDPVAKAAGLLHYQLPTKKGHEKRAEENPNMFADTGVPLLFKNMASLGGKKERLVVSIFGGASMLKDDQIFKIGIQNARAAKKLLWQQCVSIKNEDIGGNSSRTVSVEVSSGEIHLKKDGQTFDFKSLR